jgi:dihydrofolate synthase/folylpolyglutamate synthase
MQFWFDRVNFEQKAPLAGDLKLERMRQLLDILDNPHDRLRIIHVAGSKGKGSTSAMIASILQEQGYRVGLFTSPHLVAVEERIQIDQQPIDKIELAALLTEIRAAAPPALLTELTFFEIGTALGFLHFLRRQVDFAVVEVGLGGRFDTTNVCRPLLAVITSISFDHTQILGDTLARIAFEKAGIIKPNVPAISGVRAPEARQVIIDACRQRAAPLLQIDEDFHYTHEPAAIAAESLLWSRVQVVTRRRQWPALSLGLIGAHQAANAAVAIQVIEELQRQGVVIDSAAVARGLANVRWPARLEIMSRRPMVLLDCAHNVASAQALVEVLQSSFPLRTVEKARRVLIFAGSQDKDLTGMLEVLAPCFDTIYLTSFRSPRCTPPEQLAPLVPEPQRAACIQSPSPAEAWRRASLQTGPDDLICITGSVFLAGELRPLIASSFSPRAAPRER